MDNNLGLTFTIDKETQEKPKEILNAGGLKHYLIKLENNTEIDVVEYKDYKKMINLICDLIQFAYGTEMSLGEFKELFKLAFNKEYDFKKNIESQIEVFKNENT